MASTFPKFHGITLANGAHIKNAVVERLNDDPIPTEAGRIWYNNTTKRFNVSVLDDLDAVVVRSFNTLQEFNTFINLLKSNDGAVEVGYEGKTGSSFSITSGSLKTALDSIVDRFNTLGAGDIGGIQQELDDTQAGAGLATDGHYITPVASTYLNGTSSLANATLVLDSELNSVSTELNTSQSNIGLNADGTYTANATAHYVNTATSLKNADDLLDAAVYAGRVGAGLNTNGSYTLPGTTYFIDESSSLAQAIGKLDVALNQEETSRLNTDNAIIASVGLNANGTFTAYVGKNYITGQTQIKSAISTLDSSLYSVNTAVNGRIDDVYLDLASNAISEGASLIGLYDPENKFSGVGEESTVEQALFSLKESIVETTGQLTFQGIYDNSPAAEPVTIVLTEDKPFKIQDDNTVTYFEVHPDDINPVKVTMTGTVDVLGDMVISGNLSVTGSSTIIESTVTSHDHMLLSPDAGSTVAFKIQPKEGIHLADLIEVHSTNTSGIVFSIGANETTTIKKLNVSDEIIAGGAATFNEAVVVNSDFSIGLGIHQVQFGGNILNNVGSGLISTDAVNLGQLTSAIGDVNTTNDGLVLDLGTETTNRENADIAIVGAINNQLYTFDSTDDAGVAQSTYTITHGLGSLFVNHSVFIRGDGDLYRNEVVSVEQVDANQIKVYLIEPRHIRASIRSLTQVSI